MELVELVILVAMLGILGGIAYGVEHLKHDVEKIKMMLEKKRKR